MHLISCNWLPFYRPCSFASRTFIWFADFLMIALNVCKKTAFIILWHSTVHKKKITVLMLKNKKEQPIHIPNCSPTSEVHAALTLLFPAHLYSDCSISLKLLSVFLSNSPNYLPEKTMIMSRLMLYIFFKCEQRRQVFLRHDSSQ